MKTPVVLIIYHRPEMVANIIGSLRTVKPSKIFVIADGPKNRKDKQKCEETRELIKLINWECKIYKNYSSKNLGLRKRVVSGLNWVFSKVDRVIILEDDLVIHKDFYKFCEQMLERYKNNSDIISIAGNNFIFGKHRIKASYFFSRYTYSWGWATWRSRWKLYKDNMNDWPRLKRQGSLKSVIKGSWRYIYWTKIFDLTYRRIIDSWAYCFMYTSFVHKKYTVVPIVNLVSNVGAGKSATHTSVKSKALYVDIQNLAFPLKHPKKVEQDLVADSITEKTLYFTPRIIIGLLLRSFLQKGI
jgi:hypothetical protein